MPGTHTPTQTWHATAQYPQTGEVITESVAKEAGTFAMDNIARIVGTASGATPQAVRRLATVADLAALKAIAAADRADQDYCAIDTGNGERVYKFDSAGAATGDDYAIVTPNAGAGRWHLVNAKPKTMAKRWVCGPAKFTQDDTGSSGGAARDLANGRILQSGSTSELFAQFDGFNNGDVITKIELVGNANVGGGGVNIVADFYMSTANDAGTSPTVTALGTLTITAGSGNTTQSATAAPLPITFPEGASHSVISVKVTANNGAPTSTYLYWCALSGTRSYITE